MKQKIYRKLMKLKKETIADILSGCIDLLYHRPFEDNQTRYLKGWIDSREAIIDIMNLKKFMP